MKLEEKQVCKASILTIQSNSWTTKLFLVDKMLVAVLCTVLVSQLIHQIKEVSGKMKKLLWMNLLFCPL